MAVATTAQGARSQLLLKKQTALGSQATGNFTLQRYNTHSLNTAKQGVESQELRSDREVQDFRHGNRNGAGEIVTELVFGDHDTLIESAMFSTFDTDSIDIGVDPQYLSIEDGALDISQYRMFVDMIANSMSIVMAPNQMVQATFGMVGTDGAAPTGSSNGGTAVAASSNSPFDSFNAALYDNIAETGSEIAIITGLTINVENAVNPAFAVGQQTPINLEYGRGRVSGEVTVYYEDATWIEAFINETESVLIANITDPDSNVMEFRMPRVKYNGADVPVDSEQSRIITLPFVALRDSAGIGTALRISKV